jgi:hypothetical protein
MLDANTLSFSPENLYFGGKRLVFPDGLAELDFVEPPIPPSRNDRYHQVSEGESLDALAAEYYANQVPNPSRYWHAIAFANQIENPMQLQALVGQVIVIPDILLYNQNR